LVKDNATAIYLSAQSKESDFAAVDAAYFDKVFSTVQVQ
jgi:hypothetical protein